MNVNHVDDFKTMDRIFAVPRARRTATLGRRPSAASHAPNAPLEPYGPCRRPSAPMTLATRPGTSPRPPLRGRFGALRADARPFAVDRAARRGRFASRPYPTTRRDGETRVPRRYGRCEDAPLRRDAFFAHVRCAGSSVEFTKLLPISVKFRMFFGFMVSYRDYMKLAEFGKLANFTRTFANLERC